MQYSTSLFRICDLGTVTKVEGVTDGVHVAEDVGVEDSGITLSHLDTGVTEHTRDIFETDTLRESEGSVGMMSYMCGQGLVYQT